MKTKHVNIPIFLPQLACPHRCIFCNQNHISSQESVPTPEEADGIIRTHLQTIAADTETQVAFFGGSFTGLPLALQEAYLKVVQAYIETGQVQSIRLSTRPDYITDEILSLLAKYHVKDIELGAQSTNDEVLRKSGRGHTREDIARASAMIKEAGFRLGLQMMEGLPGDNYERAMQTAQDIIDFGAETTRIYPTLVVADTPLARLYTEGRYTPLSLDNAVSWTKDIYARFIEHDITVLKVGLHPNKDFLSQTYLLAGPFHPSFKELVLSELWKDRLKPLMQNNCKNLNITIYVNPEEINNAIGWQSSNRNSLSEYYKTVTFRSNAILHGNEFTYCRH